MRILHGSDTHGNFPKLRGFFDVVVHSGDLLPDSIDRSLSIKNQTDWVEEHINDFKTWLDGKPFLFTLGNHDFIPAELLEHILNSNGIKAYHLHDRIVSYGSANFYGFPYVPTIDGSYNYERMHGKDMVVNIDEMVSHLNQTYVDVLVAHCTPSNC